MKEQGMQGNGVEGVIGMFDRAQKLKWMLEKHIMLDVEIQNQKGSANIVDEGIAKKIGLTNLGVEIANYMGFSSKNKILVITHDNMMKALTAENLRYNPMKENTIYSPFDLVGGKTFEYCEAYPYHLE